MLGVVLLSVFPKEEFHIFGHLLGECCWRDGPALDVQWSTGVALPCFVLLRWSLTHVPLKPSIGEEKEFLSAEITAGTACDECIKIRFDDVGKQQFL